MTESAGTMHTSAMHTSARRTRAILTTMALLALGPGCKDTRPAPGGAQKTSEAAAAAPRRASPTQIDLGPGPIRNPLNLHDMDLAGSPDHETAGAIDDARVTMPDLEAQSVGAFSRIGQEIYDAQDNGLRWLLERAALDRQAAAARMPLIPFLLNHYETLPQPTDVDIASIMAEAPLASLVDDERRHAAISLWRLAAWDEARGALVAAGRTGMDFERIRQQISNPEYARPETVVARLGGEPITRAELRVLAGYKAELARHEYWRIARMQFEKYVTRFLREREAAHLGVTVDQLIELEIARIPEAGDADVRAFIKENPEYGRDPDGHERARDNLRRLRGIRAEEALDKRLADAASVRFFLAEPEIGRFPVEVPGPRWHGPREAQDVLVAFHGVGCETCTRGSRLLLSVLEKRPNLKLLAGDYFAPGRLSSYRGALALHCAPPESRDALLRALIVDAGTGEIAGLVATVAAQGIEAERFRACLLDDAFLPVIVENLAMTRRLGLERDVPGLFANGVRIGELKDLDKVLEQIDGALAAVEP